MAEIEIEIKLFDLIKSHKIKEFTKLLTSKKYSDIDVNLKDNNNNNLLTYAVILNNIEAVQLLLEKKARIDITIDTDKKSILFYVIKYGYTNILKLLLEANKKLIGISILDVRDKNMNIPLHYAIILKNIEYTELLLKEGSNTNLQDVNGYTALYFAIYTRNIDMIKLVLSYNTDPTIRLNNGETILHLATNLQEIQIIKLLLNKDYDIDINAQDYELNFTCLHYAINLSNIEIVLLLLNNDININIQDINGNTAIHYSILDNNYEIFDTLMKTKKVNVNLWNIDGNLPLHLVFILLNLENVEKNLPAIKKYIDSLIEITNLNIPNNNGNTCFHYICKYNLWQLFKNILKTKKLDINIINNNKIKPIDYIKKKDMDQFIDLIVESYINRLRRVDTQWPEEWQNICKKELYSNNLNDIGKKILKQNKIKLEDNIDLCKKIIIKKIQNIIVSKNTCYRTYPTKTGYLCINVSEGQKIGICTFTGSTLDMLIGLIYLLTKHENSCSTINKNITQDDDLCNFYKKFGIIMSSRCEFLNFEIIWAFNHLYVNYKFNENFNNCLNNTKKRFIIIPLGIELSQGSHANYLIYDKKYNEIERFEPNGADMPQYFNYNADEMDKSLKEIIGKITPNVTYFKPKDFLPKIGFQLLDSYEYKNKKIGDPEGFCALWAIWYVDMRISYKDIDRKKLVDLLIQQIKLNNISFRNMIRNYAYDIIQIRDKILSSADIDINDWINDKLTETQLKNVIENLNSEIHRLFNE